jgi:sugar diacid utilization regulator
MVAVAPASSHLVRQLSAVAQEFTALVTQLQAHTEEWGQTSEQATLARLLAGECGADDATAAGLSFADARLLVATMPDTQTAVRLVEQLRGDRGAVAILHPPANLVVLIRGVPLRAHDDRGHRAALRVAGAVLRAAPAVSVGVSSPLASAEHVHVANAEAFDALTLAGTTNDRVVFADECWAQLTAQRLARQAKRVLPLDNPLTRLRRYDERRGTDFARTLSMWLDANGDTAATAAAMSLHPNTLRYRIRRVRDICGLDIDDPNARALTHLLLRGW